MAIGVGATDATFTMGTGEILLRVPETIRVNFQGELPPYLTAKDLILRLLGNLTTYGANYCAIEFGGEVIAQMSIDERMTLCNMVAESGAKNAIMVPNEATLQYLQQSTSSPWEIFVADKDAGYLKTIEYDVSTLTPLVALPHSPDNITSINAVAGTLVDRAYIGSCTGGKLTDFIAAAQLLSGQKVVIETLAVPASNAVIEGIMSYQVNGSSVYQTLLEAGVKISLEASCAACCGGLHDTFGRLHDPKTVISTTNRNFPGRMGSKQAQIYLASPYTVAASAIAGCLTNPQNFLS
jgi:3-isopropylmalate/(R)-2-methylmalate dehydratase large subunit